MAVDEDGVAENVALGVAPPAISEKLFAVIVPIIFGVGVLFPPTNHTGETPAEAVMIVPGGVGSVKVPPPADDP